VSLKGFEWHKSDVALMKLKQMLWGVEALHEFDDRLVKTLQEIKEGKEKMEGELARVRYPQRIVVSH
jgi:hypothetical protein